MRSRDLSMAASRYGFWTAPDSTRSTERPSARRKAEEIRVAGLWIEVRAACGGAERLEPSHIVSTAEFRQFFLLVSDGGVPDHSPDCGGNGRQFYRSSRQRRRRNRWQLAARHCHVG